MDWVKLKFEFLSMNIDTIKILTLRIQSHK